MHLSIPVQIQNVKKKNRYQEYKHALCMCVVMNFELPVVLVASYQTRVEQLNYFSSVAAGELRLLLCHVLALGTNTYCLGLYRRTGFNCVV